MGGGTTDLVVHAHKDRDPQNPAGLLKEIVPGSGKLCGGSHVDMAFIKHLYRTCPGLEKFFDENAAEKHQMLMKWEVSKRAFVGTEPSISIEPGSRKTLVGYIGNGMDCSYSSLTAALYTYDRD